MKANFVGITIFALALSLNAQSVNAGFTSIHVRPSDGSTIPTPYYHSDPAAGELGVYETWSAEHGTEYGFEVYGETDSDPPLHIIKEVTNGTDKPWVGYNIDLDPTEANTFELVSPAPTSDVMTLTSSGLFSLVYGLPSPVNPGDTVTFDFVINIPSTGDFSFTLSQSPIPVPEPSSCALLVLGTMLRSPVLRRRS